MRFGAPLTTLFFFGVTVATLGIMTSIFPAELAIPISGSTITPVLLLELATDPRHLVHIFGEANDPLRPSRIADMNLGNAIDYLLMPAYGLFIFSFFAGLAKHFNAAKWQIFGWLGIVAAMADAIENWLMFQIVGDMANAGPPLGFLPFAVWTKFGLLALCSAAAGWGFIQLRRPILAILCAPAPLLFIPSFLYPLEFARVGTSVIAFGWLAMAAYAFSQWRATSRAEARG